MIKLSLIAGAFVLANVVQGDIHLAEPSSPTECEMCATTGNCTRAYRQLPGQYCGVYQKHGFNEVCCCGVHQICGNPSQDNQCECTSILFQKPALPTEAVRFEDMGFFEKTFSLVGIAILSFAMVYVSFGILVMILQVGLYVGDYSARIADLKRLWRNRYTLLNKLKQSCGSICKWCRTTCMNTLGVCIKPNWCKAKTPNTDPRDSIVRTELLDTTDDQTPPNDSFVSP